MLCLCFEAGSFEVTHRHTPWSRWRWADLEGSWRSTGRCANTSPPYILCKNCDWNTLHSCLFYILKDKNRGSNEITHRSFRFWGNLIFVPFMSWVCFFYRSRGYIFINLAQKEEIILQRKELEFDSLWGSNWWLNNTGSISWGVTLVP